MRAGLLEERSGDLKVIDAISEDTTLTERQRKALLEIYAAFQTENSAQRPLAEDNPDEENS